MIEFVLDEETCVLQIAPLDPLAEEDFRELVQTVDPLFERMGKLRGLVLEVRQFPDWQSIGAGVSHLRFVRDHHRKIRQVAIFTDSMVGSLVEHFANHFVAAEIRQFDTTPYEASREWANISC